MCVCICIRICIFTRIGDCGQGGMFKQCGVDQHTEEFVFLFVFAFAFVIVFVFEFVFLQEAVRSGRNV